MDFSKNMARALRRHHAQRLKAARMAYWGRGGSGGYAVSWTPRQQGMVVHTPQICSCCSCGNARWWFGERTTQERRLFQFDVNELLVDNG